MIPRHLQIAIVLMLIAAVGLGFYTLRMKRRAEQLQQQADLHPVAPIAGPSEQVKLWVAYDDEGVLRERTVALTMPQEPAARAQRALHALVAIYLENPSSHSLGDGSDIRDVFLMNDNTAVVDVNAAFADAHRSGVLVEQLTIVSLLRTLSEVAPKLTQVRILVEGKERETLAGHADLRSTYSLDAVRQLAQEMQ